MIRWIKLLWNATTICIMKHTTVSFGWTSWNQHWCDKRYIHIHVKEIYLPVSNGSVCPFAVRGRPLRYGQYYINRFSPIVLRKLYLNEVCWFTANANHHPIFFREFVMTLSKPMVRPAVGHRLIIIWPLTPKLFSMCWWPCPYHQHPIKIWAWCRVNHLKYSTKIRNRVMSVRVMSSCDIELLLTKDRCTTATFPTNA